MVQVEEPQASGQAGGQVHPLRRHRVARTKVVGCHVRTPRHHRWRRGLAEAGQVCHQSQATRGRAAARPRGKAGISGLLLGEAVSTEEKPHMTQSQSRPRTPATWHPPAQEREGLWILTRLRDFIDDIANTTPARLAITAFAAVCTVFTFLLSLPVSSADGNPTPVHQALFTAVSAVCVTGLTVVSTAVHWSFFGQLVILVGIFI